MYSIGQIRNTLISVVLLSSMITYHVSGGFLFDDDHVTKPTLKRKMMQKHNNLAGSLTVSWITIILYIVTVIKIPNLFIRWNIF
ncbi:unnamed protein product [Schistosoma bovis]|nr:unnamed protein product [Schistosoma bovis]